MTRQRPFCCRNTLSLKRLCPLTNPIKSVLSCFAVKKIFCSFFASTMKKRRAVFPPLPYGRLVRRVRRGRSGGESSLGVVPNSDRAMVETVAVRVQRIGGGHVARTGMVLDLGGRTDRVPRVVPSSSRSLSQLSVGLRPGR